MKRLSHTAYAPQEEAQHKRFGPKASPAGRYPRRLVDKFGHRPVIHRTHPSALVGYSLALAGSSQMSSDRGRSLCGNEAEVARAVDVDSPADRREPRVNNTPFTGTLVSFAGYRGKVRRPLTGAALPQMAVLRGRVGPDRPYPHPATYKREPGGRNDRAAFQPLAPSRFSPSLLLVYPPTASLGKVRPDALSRDFPNAAKFHSMEISKNRLTATPAPNWVAPARKSRPSSPKRPHLPSQDPSRVAPSLPTRVILAYPAVGTHHPSNFPKFQFFIFLFYYFGPSFPYPLNRSYLPCIR